MRFSILVPVYNVEKYIYECLNSIINQTYKDYEIILVDDGSTDRSGFICDEYSSKYDNVIVIHQKNSGLLMTRRKAIEAANGDYLIFVDSDDFVDCNMLKRLSTVINKHYPDIIMYNAHKYSNEKLSVHKQPLYDIDKLFVDNLEELYFKLLTRKLSNTLCTKAVRRDIADFTKDYSPFSCVNLGEDLLQLMPIITNSKSVYYLNEKFYYYRTNPISLTQRYREDNYNSIKLVNLELDKYVEKWGREEFEALASYRYLVDIYDIITQIASTPRKYDKVSAVKEIVDDSYFVEKYKKANRMMLSIQQRKMLEFARNKHWMALKCMMSMYRLYLFIKSCIR